MSCDVGGGGGGKGKTHPDERGPVKFQYDAVRAAWDTPKTQNLKPKTQNPTVNPKPFWTTLG